MGLREIPTAAQAVLSGPLSSNLSMAVGMEDKLGVAGRELEAGMSNLHSNFWNRPRRSAKASGWSSRMEAGLHGRPFFRGLPVPMMIAAWSERSRCHSVWTVRLSQKQGGPATLSILDEDLLLVRVLPETERSMEPMCSSTEYHCVVMLASSSVLG